MTFDFRITKVRLPVSLIMLGGEELGGEMFVQALSAKHQGREEIPDILNSLNFIDLTLIKIIE